MTSTQIIFRLLKGDAPGRKQVSYYSGELNCIRYVRIGKIKNICSG